MTYSDEVAKKQFIGNAVILLKGQYFCVRQPDSGLSIGANYQGTLRDLTLSPTQVDLRTVNTTVASYSFTLQDRSGVVAALFGTNLYLLTGETCQIWLGRTTGSFPFSSYFKLQDTSVKSITYNGDKTFSINVTEQTDRMNKTIFSLVTTLNVDILDITTILDVQPDTDLSLWPSSGIWKIDDEFGTYAGTDNVLKQLTGCTRGLKGTTPVAHKKGATVYRVTDVTDNPLNIILQLLISKGGGGTYDVLEDGVGLDHSLVDVSQIEAIRDAYFNGFTFSFSLYKVSNALKFIEDELLAPCNLRFSISLDSKISVVMINISPFNPNPFYVDEHTMTGPPTLTVDANEVVNQVQVKWDWDEGTQTFNRISPYSDALSMSQYGAKPPFPIEMKGPHLAAGGQTFVDTYAARMLGRFKQPMPQVDMSTQMDQSLLAPGAKATVATTKLPTLRGDYAFAYELETLSRAINWATGDVQMTMMFTQYSDVKQCFIAPSHNIINVANAHTITVASGGGAYYRVGWPMRVFDRVALDWPVEPPNVIASIVGDVITFANDFATVPVAGSFRLTMPKYDETILSQRAFCFVDVNGSNFPDGTLPYLITF